MMNINSVLDPTTVDLLELRQPLKTPEAKLWRYGALNELARLSQVSKEWTIKATNKINLILLNQKPTNKKSTYTQTVVSYRPQKEDPYRVWITVGGDKFNYAGETFTQNAVITTSKCLFNSAISTNFSQLLGLDTKDF